MCRHAMPINYVAPAFVLCLLFFKHELVRYVFTT
jgi:hypothetical protein